MNAKLLNRLNWGRTAERQEQQEVKFKCRFCGEWNDYNNGYGVCFNNCEMEHEIQNAAPIIWTESDVIKYLKNGI